MSSACRAIFGRVSAKLEPRLAVLGELERAPQQVAGQLLVVGDLGRGRLAVVLRQHRLGVEQVDMARPAVHEELDHRLRPGRGSAAGAGGQSSGSRSRIRPGPRPGARPGPDRRSSRPGATGPRGATGRAIREGRRGNPSEVDDSSSAGPRLGSIHVHELVATEEHLADVGRRGQRPPATAIGLLGEVAAEERPLIIAVRRPAEGEQDRMARRVVAVASRRTRSANASAWRISNSLLSRFKACDATVEVDRRVQFVSITGWSKTCKIVSGWARRTWR